MGRPGLVVDLFTGAGGLSLGFHWAGWKSIIANDIDPTFLQTYQKNIGGDIVVGDIRDKLVFKSIVDRVLKVKRENPKIPIIVIGGPPCQGFSTAGKKRSMEDERNHLFKSYKKILDVIKPTAFVFENVSGLLNMEGGAVFQLITRTLSKTTDELKVLKLKAEEFGVPQKRTRVVIIGHNKDYKINDLKPVSSARFVSCKESLDDLPPLNHGEDGSSKKYLRGPKTIFQKLMRGDISINKYLKFITSQV